MLLISVNNLWNYRPRSLLVKSHYPFLLCQLSLSLSLSHTHTHKHTENCYRHTITWDCVPQYKNQKPTHLYVNETYTVFTLHSLRVLQFFRNFRSLLSRLIKLTFASGSGSNRFPILAVAVSLRCGWRRSLGHVNYTLHALKP
jgi:hypothetical protein